MTEDWTKTTCPYCGVGCGVLASAGPSCTTAKVKGDPDHPANFGRLCSKGAALGETLSLDERLLWPQIGARRASWNDALDNVADNLQRTVDQYGPDSVAMYVSGQLLTEDYYVANKFMKGFLGTPNIDTNSRLCMSSSVAGHKRAFGSDTVPGVYEDLECADLVVLVGSNLAWCHPVLYQRLASAKEQRGTKVVVVDPRVTATCAIADLHLSIKPGTDVILFNGLLAHLHSTGAINLPFIDNATTGWDSAISMAQTLSFDDVLSKTELGREQVSTFFSWFEKTERTVTVYSQGVNQSSSGTDKVNSIITCHLATGRIGCPGMGPFSVTGQPNAMGGREVGGLANMLAAHMELDNPEHRRIVSDFWGVPSVPDRPGLKAVELFQAINEGRIKAVWIIATNPVDSLPDANTARVALSKCPYVVVSDVTANTDTAEFAHVLLPATAWGEKDGTVTNSERRISRQRAFLSAPGETKPDWWQVSEVAKRCGFADAFAYRGPRDIFVEYASMTGAENGGSRDLDVSPLSNISLQQYDDLKPFQWPLTSYRKSPRFFGDGQFFTNSRRAAFVALEYREPASRLSEQFPFVLNTGRIRDQWHTMTRTAKTARLLTHIAEPFVEVNPSDASRLGLTPASLARLRTQFGEMIARVSVTDRQRVGSVFVPMHWTEQFSSSGRVGPLVAPNVDPLSGQPESKFGAVAVELFKASWYGFAVTLEKPELKNFDYAARSKAGGGYRIEFAYESLETNWESQASAILACGRSATAELQTYSDNAKNQHRFAIFADGRCEGLLFVARQPVAVSRSWAVEQLGETIAPEQRISLLAGSAGKGAQDRGSIVCACFGVGLNDIVREITERDCKSVSEVGDRLQAGTNCGSCKAEIGKIIDKHQLEQAL